MIDIRNLKRLVSPIEQKNRMDSEIASIIDRQVPGE